MSRCLSIPHVKTVWILVLFTLCATAAQATELELPLRPGDSEEAVRTAFGEPSDMKEDDFFGAREYLYTNRGITVTVWPDYGVDTIQLNGSFPGLNELTYEGNIIAGVRMSSSRDEVLQALGAAHTVPDPAQPETDWETYSWIIGDTKFTFVFWRIDQLVSGRSFPRGSIYSVFIEKNTP